MARTRRRRSSSAATTSSRHRISMPPCRGRRAARGRPTGPWRCVPSGRTEIRLNAHMPQEIDQQARQAAEAVARRSYGKLISFLAARTRDVAGAEDALSEAFAAALAGWPITGLPANPEAWLLTVARRRMIDAGRKRRTAEQASIDLQLITDVIEAAVTDRKPIPDERLRLMFACTHPAIDVGVRAPLMLQTILGFDAGTIASSFLVSPATMGQRLVRAKAKIRQAGIPFRIPEHEELSERLGA